MANNKENVNNQDDVLALYNNLKADGYEDLGTADEFRKKVSDRSVSDQLYNNLKEDGYDDLGTSDEFFDRLNPKATQRTGMVASSVQPKEPTVRAEDGMVFTKEGLDSLEQGYKPVYVEAKRDFSKPIDLSRPEETTVPLPFAQYGKEMQQQVNNPRLTQDWAKQQAEARGQIVNPTKPFGERIEDIQRANEVEAARRQNRSEFDRANFGQFYDKISDDVLRSFNEEREAGEQRARKEVLNNIRKEVYGENVPQNPSGVMSGIGRAFQTAVAVERETDPEKIVGRTLQRVQDNEEFGDYVLSRMGINGQTAGDGGESPQLTEEEKRWMQRLFAKETGEVADQVAQNLYDQYKKEGAPQSALDYIAGKAFNENFAASLFNAMVRRAANSSGIREQLRAMASEEYGQSLDGFGGWATRMAGGAAPFAVDILTGGFAVPSAVGQALVKGGTRLAAKEVTKEMGKRAAARGLEDAALKEAVAGSAEIAERYIATQAPILNIALRTAGSAANFATYDVQSELVRQLAEGDFNAGNLVKQAVHGATLGGAMGVAGGMIGQMTRNSGLAGKIAGSLVGVGTETGIFAAANGIAKAQELGIDITDVDWSDTTGEALGMVVGMKIAGAMTHPKEFVNRYRQSKVLGMQLNQRDIDELKQAGYDLGGIFKGLGEFGKMAPQNATVKRGAAEYSVDADGKRTQRNTETEEAYVDADAFNNMLSNPDISSSVKRKLTYIATGKVLSVEPAFGASMNVDENGKASITTLNAYGNPIETKEYKSQEEAQKDFDAIQEATRTNTIGGLERIADQAGFQDVKDIAKARTQEETGQDVDDVERLAELEPADVNKVLDSYIKNLQDSFMERFNENLERIGEAGTAPDGAGTVVRSERRQAAYDRGMSVVDDDSQLPGMRYDGKAAEARMMAQMPDGSGVEAIRQQVMQAVESGDMEGAEAILQRQSPYLSEQQREAVESYLDSRVASQGVADVIQQQREDYEQERREQVQQIADPQGMVTPLQLKDGSTVYYQSGDLNGFHSNVFVTTADGEARQISSSDIVNREASVPAEDIIMQDVQSFQDQLAIRYQMLHDGSLLKEGQEVDIVYSGQMFHLTCVGHDEQGNNIVRMGNDNKTIAFTPDETREMVDAADTYKIQQMLAEERDAAALQKRTERFLSGIVGYEQGVPDLTHKDTKPEVAAEFLLSQPDGDGGTIDHAKALIGVQQEIDRTNSGREQMQQALQNARTHLAMAEDGSEEQRQAAAVIAQLEPQVADMERQRRKWGEIRQAMMTDEERQAFEKDRIKAVGNAKTQSKKAVEPAGEPAGGARSVVPTSKEVLERYGERSDGEAFVEGKRKELSKAYKDDVYPRWDDIEKQLNDYQHGLTDLTADDIKALTDEQAVLEARMSQMVLEQNAWKKLLSDIGRAYTIRERQQMTPHEQAMSRLAGETDKVKKIKLAQEAFKDDAEALSVLDNLEPQDINEHIAANLGAGSINWEGLQRGEHYVRGLQDEMGKDKTRGVGSQYDTNAYNYFLAPTGQGKGFEEVVHNIAEGSPYDVQDVRNALRDMLAAATKPTDISHLIEDSRIAEAERIYQGNLERERDAEREAELEAENDAIREATGMEPDEYDAYMGDLEQRLAEQAGYRDSEEYFKYIEEYEQRANERGTGGGQAQGAVVVQGSDGEPARVTQTVAKRAGAAAEGEVEQQAGEIFPAGEQNVPSVGTNDSQGGNNTQAPVLPEVEGGVKETAANVQENENNSVTLQSNTENHGAETGEHNAEQRSEGTGLREQPAGGAQGGSDGVDISVLTEGLRPEQSGDNENRPRHQQEAFGNHVIEKAKENGLYIEPSSWKDFGKRVGGISGESIVYVDEATGRVVKVKDPFAKAPMKGHSANDAIYEHIVHNLLFPNSRYELIGISESNGDVRFVLTQDYLKDGYTPATQEQIDNYLINELGLKKENDYYYGNDDLAITDVGASGDNVLVGPDGELHFIDPIIKFKKPATEVLKKLGYDRTREERKDEESLVQEGLRVDGEGSEVPSDSGEGGVEDTSFAGRLAKAKEETNVSPTDEQKKAGNYKMGHISFGGYRMSIENPKGSVRSGVDANGKPWSIEMQDTYGYIGKKYGTDGDHLDFFINDDADLDTWNGRVFVIDQGRPATDQAGKPLGTLVFDEHKVMYGYPTLSAARKAYERNYEPGWWDKHVMKITGVRKVNFDKWLEESDHKTKPFSDYFSTKILKDAVSDPMDELLANVEERKGMKPAEEPAGSARGVATTFKNGELEGKSIDELRQLKKKKQQDKSTSKVLLGTTNIQKGGLKERTLTQNIAQAEADLAAIDKVLSQKQAETAVRIEQQEIGGAMVDQLEGMGFDVTTDRREMRRVRKQAEQDNSKEGKLRHMRTSNGDIYGFTYRGKMYLDPTKIDAELPMHEYGHPWCEAFRRLNPEGWKNIVRLMKGDKDTWAFIKQLNPDLTEDDDIAEEMITKCSGQRGAEYARKEYERMNAKDPDYKSKWGNIWKNISKAIQDFWKQVGDFLHIKYESVEQVYDQVIRDFANKINPRKRVEDWLKERDKSYVKAVESGDDAKAKAIFDEALRENVGNGITPYVSAGGYRGKMQKLAHGVKTRDAKVIAEVADLMAPLIPKDAVLVPAPSHTGRATDMLDLAQAISERTGAPVADVLTSKERGSQYDAKKAGKPLSMADMGIEVTGEPLPTGKIPVVIDNVVDTGNTAEACVRALGKGIVASLASSKGRYKRVTSLKSAEPVVTDKHGHVVPLSERFEFMIEEGSLFSDEDFQEPKAKIAMTQLNEHGLNESTPIGRKLTEFLKENDSDFTLSGYIDSKTGEYVFLGDNAWAIEQLANIKPGQTGQQDGMDYVRLTERDFDVLSPKLVRDGYRMAFLSDDSTDGKPSGTVAKEGETHTYNVGDKLNVLFNGQEHEVEVLGVEPGGDLLLSIDGTDAVPTPVSIFDEYVRNSEKAKEEKADEPVIITDSESLLKEVERRKDVSKDKKDADDIVKRYLKVNPKDDETEQARKRATKAELKAMDNAGVPYKVVSKEEEKQMLKLFSMMNQESIKEFARRASTRAMQPHGRLGKYIVYNMNDPYGIPVYFEKLSTAKYGLKDLKELAPEGDWAILDIGLPGEEVRESEVQRRAAELRELMQMMGGNKKATETAPLNPKKGSPADISTASGAKIAKNLDSLVNKLEKVSNTRKNFLAEAGNALEAEQEGSGSWYKTFVTKDGSETTIRLGNHNATVKNFDFRNEEDGISIVVSKRGNEGVNNNGNAHIVEFFYPETALRKAYGNPLADIVRSIKEAASTGKYSDPTGIAQVEEVNSFDDLELMMGWHGSGARFDAFDHRYMGSGEGNQAYGWGTYITEVEGIGRIYAEAIGDVPKIYVTHNGKQIDATRLRLGDVENKVARTLSMYDGYKGRAIASLENEIRLKENRMNKLPEEEDTLDRSDFEKDINFLKECIESLKNDEWSYKYQGPQHFLYKVDIPEDTGENYLDWTTPLPQERAEKILAEVRERLLTDDKYGWKGKEDKLDERLEAMKSFFGETFYWRVATLLGNSVAGAHRDGHRMTSELLSQHGYVGVKYPAEYRSGGRDDGAMNYVIFNEGDAKIKETIEFMVGGTDADATGTVAPTFQKEGKQILGWSDGKQVYLTQAGLNPNTPLHECTHLWDKWCMKEHPELWAKVVSALKKTEMWKQITENPNYRNIWNDENRIASEVHSRLSGAAGEDEFMKAAFKKSTPQSIINEVKSVLRKFWEAVLRLFNKHTKTIADDFESLASIVRMPIRDLVNEDFEKVMKATGSERADAMLGYHGSGAKEEKADELKQRQLDTILKENPADDENMPGHTWIRTIDDIKTFSEAVDEDGYAAEEGVTPDFTADMVKEALDKGVVTVYSSKPIKDGAFVTPSKMEATNYAGGGKVYSKEVSLTDVAWIDPLQGQYAKVSDDIKTQKAENGKTLVGLHNLSVDQLRRALKNGGLANPSAAVIDILKQTHDKYGDVTLVLPNKMVEAKTGKHKGVFGGDIYSPNYPEVHTRLSDKNQDKLAKWISDNAGENGQKLNLFQYFLQNIERSRLEGLEYLFLKEKGVDMSQIDDFIREGVENFWLDYLKKYDNAASLYQDWLKDEKMRSDITKNIVAKEVDELKKPIIRAAIDQRRAEGQSDEQIKKELTKIRFEAYKQAKKEVEESLLDDNGGIGFNIVETEFFKNYRLYQNRGDFDTVGTRWNVGKYIRDNNLFEEYHKWAQEVLDRYEPREVLYNGTDYDGRPRYVANTLENASRIMKKQGLQAGDSFFAASMGGARAQLTPVFKTLNDIRKNKWRLGEQEFEDAKAELESEYYELAGLFENSSSYYDGKYYDLIDAMKSGDAYQWAHKNGFDISKEDGARIDAFADALRNMPTGYFELKFERPVGIDEFAVAVVPNSTPFDVIDQLEKAGLDVRTYDSTGTEEEQNKNRWAVLTDAVGMRDDILFHIEDDAETLERLDSEPTEVGYRNVAVNEDGTLGSPMANRLGKKGAGRKATTSFEYGKWERSDENPDLADENGKINLIKPNGKPVEGVDYNPYIHIRPNKVNKQFKEAWRRPELIYVETEYPKSELAGGYRAEKAAKAVGKHPWGGGELILSRWDKPVRMVPWEEVADDWEQEFAGRGVEFDIVPPALLPILAERGMEILPPHKGTGKDCREAYERFLAGEPQGTVEEAGKRLAGEPQGTVAHEVMARRVTPAENEANAAYNKQLDEYANGKMSSGKIFELGEPSPVLKICGVTGKQIKMKQSVLADHMKKHNLTFDDLKNLPSALYHPIMVYQWGDNAKSHVIVTELTTQDGRKVTVTIRVNNAGEVLDVEKITSVHGKDLEHIIQEINTDKTDFVKDNLKYVNKEKALEWLTMDPPKGSRITIQELNSAAKLIKDSDLSKYYAKKIAELYPELTNAVEAAGEQLGGVKVVLEALGPEEGTLGWYDPNDNSVHVVVPAHANVEEAVRTVFHEKLGHEGLVALLGSQEAVNKFGTFIFKSAGKTLRKRIMEKADENDPEWKKGDRFSTAAQEVFADIAADGPRTEEEFSLWDKVKHYIIRLCNKIGLRIRGLLNDKDLRYYVLKTGEALKKWDKLDEGARENLARQAGEYEILRSRGGKPRKRKNESDAQYFQRLRAWEKWKVARDTARDNGDPEPEEVTFHEQAEADFRADLQEWKERNGIAEGETFSHHYPRREEGETPQAYAMRIAEYESKSDLWKTAPSQMDYLARANEDYRRAYQAWRERYDLQEEMSVDQRLYEGDVNPTPTFTDADMEAEALAERDLAEAVGMEVDEAGAKRHAKLAVIERRKNMESSNAEDALWICDFIKQTEDIAARISAGGEPAGEPAGSARRKVTGKELREALPFLIEADRRRENLQAEREDVVQVINMSDAIQQAHSFIDYSNLDAIGEELKALNEAWNDKTNNPNPIADLAYHDAAARLADKLNDLHKDYAGYNPLYVDDIMQIRSLLASAAVAGGGDVMPESAKRFEGLPEVQQLMDHVKEWYDEFFQILEDAGLRGDAGYIGDGYVNHVWDKAKSDPKAWEKYVENRQRTKSPNMRHREIDTYMDGIEIGLVPKYSDIAEMIAHYSRQNNEAVANRRFLDDIQFVVVEEMNSEGEVTAILPLIEFDKPSSFVRERYMQYYVPGCGDVYVLKHIQKRFANIFGTMRTPDAADWLSQLAKGYDLTSSTAKKIQLALSGFHALALFEVDMAQNNPAKALKHLFEYIIADSIKSGTLPAYAHPEDFRLAAKHLVQLGATEDYAAADVNAITTKLRETFKSYYESDELWKKAAGAAGSPVAIFMDWINKGFDTVLWNYLHDGLKLCAFKELAKQVDRRITALESAGTVAGLEEMREKLLDEAGQYVNDMFGGQYWELINVSPATLKWMRRAFLSPDWLISTQRHFFANFGFGSVYSESGFRNYVKYNTDNIQRLLGKDVPRDELRRLRSKNAKYCYLIGAMVWWGLFYNAINALCRRKDEEDEKAKAEEMRKTNPNYKSPYELAYPDGMKWYDYTMYGNTIGQQTHLFTGRYADGTETYVRWGKQFREFPELFIGRHGLEFPAPIIQRMMSKANPNIGTVIDFLGAQNIGGFNGSYENKELREKYGKTVATLASTARHFIPFGMPTQAEKEYKWLDFFMPSSKGFSRWKAKDYFETFILDGDWEGIEATYKACVMNGVDAEKNLEAAIASIKATQKKELADGVVDLTSAAAKFDAATDPNARKLFLSKLKKHLKGGDYKVFTKDEAMERVQSFWDGDVPDEKENTRYIMLATSEDIIAEERLKDLGRQAKKYIKKINDAPVNEQEAMESHYAVWFDIDEIVREASRDIREAKKGLGGMDDDERMAGVRKAISDAQREIDQLEAPR